MYLLDTNVLSELKRDRPSPTVLSWFRDVREEDVYLHVIVIGEIHRGIVKASKIDPARATQLRVWLDDLQRTHKSRILDLTRDVAETWGEITLDRQHLVDRVLAATAMNYDMTLVTRNVKHVADTGAQVLNPFENETCEALDDALANSKDAKPGAFDRVRRRL